jgi:SOS-response transcriptional repressor LexA
MKRPITPGQRRVLDFLRDFHAQNDQLPPIQAIAAHFGWSSWNAAQTHIMGLVKRGYLERNEVGKWRFSRAQIPDAGLVCHRSSDER